MDARAAGLIAAAVPLAAVVFGASVVGLIPRMIVGGVLVFIGLAFMVGWVWDKRRVAAPTRVRGGGRDLGGDHRLGVPDRGRDRAGARRGAVRDQLRPDRAGPRGRLRRDLPLQRRSAGRRARRAPHALRSRPDPAGVRVRVLRLDEPPAGADPTARGRGHAAAVPGDRSAARDGRGLLGGRLVREGAPPGGGLRLRGRVHGRLRPGARTAGPRRRGRDDGLVSFEPDLDRGLQRCEDALLSTWPRRGERSTRPGPRRPAAASRGLPRACLSRGGHGAAPPGRRRPATSTCWSPGDSAWSSSRRRATQMRAAHAAARGGRRRGRAVHGGPRVPRTSWPRPRPSSCGSAARRSSGWRPRSRSSPRRCTGGSRRRWRSVSRDRMRALDSILD